MDKNNRFFSRLYGADALSATLIALSMLSLIIILIVNGGLWSLLAALPAAIALFRILSTKKEKRQHENAVFLGTLAGIRGSLRLAFCRFRDRKTHLYFSCPCCQKTLRVARGNGEVGVACPGCRTISRLDTGDGKREGTAEEQSA